MKTFRPFSLSRCDQCPLSRRHFLGLAGAACAGLAASAALPQWSQAAATPTPKMKLRLVFALHAPVQPGPDWPNKGFDFRPFMQKVERTLTRQCRDFEFLTSTATGPEQAAKILEEDKSSGVQGYVVFQMNCWNRVVQTLAGSGKPTLYADFQYGGSGGFLVYNAAFLRAQTPNVGFVASSNLEDLVDAVACFRVLQKGGTAADFVAATARLRQQATRREARASVRDDRPALLPIDECVRRMRQSKILAVRDQSAGPEGTCMEIPVQRISFAELNEAWKNANKEEARLIAYRWSKGAAKVAGVDWSTLETSAAMYLAQKEVMKRHQANAITINCLGGFYGGHIHAYPCLGFYELLNEGLIGACECDIRSTATMVAFTTLTQGRPGYISDPVMDTAKGQIIYAHCVASSKPFGPQGRANPYQILTHSEDRQGASVRSLLPAGYLLTTLEVDNGRKEILLHRARAVGNDPDDRACRTKLCAVPLGDFEKLFTFWDQWGWHRVTFYGDLREPAFELAKALGWKVVEEA
ncbi:MAG: twin-arginine translocation signal domain-containing protein [Verrucomicrobiae bacterium]|nr:twin-arginine translocation signal domain-containing protein [Verrucomicrobiae bacterium]